MYHLLLESQTYVRKPPYTSKLIRFEWDLEPIHRSVCVREREKATIMSQRNTYVEDVVKNVLAIIYM